MVKQDGVKILVRQQTPIVGGKTVAVFAFGFDERILKDGHISH